jgi:RNA polymerase sigma-70 factor (ECF subfamily)
MRQPFQDPPSAEQFERIVEEYSDRVYSIGLRICGSERDAEDALQETFVAVFRGLGAFRGDAALSTWIYRIAVNAALQIRRAHPVDDRILVELPEPDEVEDWSGRTPESQAEQDELRDRLEQAISQLPEEMRLAVVLRDVQGLSAAEAAEVLSIGEAALKSRLHRGRLLLRAVLAEYFQRP